MNEFEHLKAQKDRILLEQAVRPYTEATKLAMKLGQTVGPKSDYYVTLRQLEQICKEGIYDPNEKQPAIINVRIPEAQHFADAANSVRLAIIYERLLKIERELKEIKRDR